LRSFDHEPRNCLLGSWHSPSNAHAYRLYVVKELCAAAFTPLRGNADP
jgi:hypothetical protein